MGNECIRITRDFTESTERLSKGWGRGAGGRAGHSAKRDSMKNTKLVVGLEVKRELFRHQKKKKNAGIWAEK